ncbi:MAG: hypothetical protein C4576_10105 [Desulfobacteraceae bacterium]|nr:MAG: hypothetical protein C4576_10105 [Desulfobacteraceae bacterium]
MKRLIALVLLSSFLFGCGAAARESEFWKHPAMYASWNHMDFSISGYKQPTAQTGKQSMEEKWWGIPVPYIPAK